MSCQLVGPPFYLVALDYYPTLLVIVIYYVYVVLALVLFLFAWTFD